MSDTNEHPVALKLRREILPWLISAQRLRRQWFYRLHAAFGFTTDGLAALAAAGLMPVAWATLFGDPTNGGANGEGAFTTLSASLSPLLTGIVTIVLGIWVLLRVAFNRQDGQKRAVLAKSCAQSLHTAHSKLYQILVAADPMPEINKLYVEQIIPTVDRTTQEGAWPFVGPARDIDKDVQNEMDELCRKFASGWHEVPLAAFRAPREVTQ